MKIETYERAFLTVGAILLVACMGALVYASVGMGLHLPGRAGEINPEDLAATPPFDQPGVRQTGPNAYEIVMVGQVWAFVPGEVHVPAGADVTITATTADVLHGLHVDGTTVNLMLIPGQISKITYRFTEPGAYAIICHEYCGVGHHTMYGMIHVE